MDEQEFTEAEANMADLCNEYDQRMSPFLPVGGRFAALGQNRCRALGGRWAAWYLVERSSVPFAMGQPCDLIAWSRDTRGW